MSNSQQTVQDIHDILKSYYKVAQKRFTDNICMQAADFYLVTGPESPMKLFSPSWVYNLSREQLESIAGEEPSLRRKRRQLRKQVKELEAGKKYCSDRVNPASTFVRSFSVSLTLVEFGRSNLVPRSVSRANPNCRRTDSIL